MPLDIIPTAHAQVTENPNPGFFFSFGNNSPGNVLGEVILTLLAIAGIVSILFLILGGFQYVMSGASEEQAMAGKKRMLNSVIGLIIILLSYTIISVIYTTLTE